MTKKNRGFRLTDFDLKLLGLLQKDARRSNTNIARELRVGESVELDVELPRIESVANEIARMPEVVFVCVTTGASDIFFTAVFRSNDDVYHFISRRLARIKGVRNTSTSSILRVMKRTMAYGVPDGRYDGLPKRRTQRR
jgi:DNA-binding Lrp family transcriptional regulator